MGKKTEESKPSGDSLYKKSIDFTSSQFNWLKTTLPYRVATSPGVPRVIGVVGLATAATVPAAALGLGAIATGAGADTLLLAETRSLKHEYLKLIQYINANTKEDYILNNLVPNLKEILDTQLVKHAQEEGKKSLTEDLPIDSINWSKAKSWGRGVIKNGKGVANSAGKCIKENSVQNGAMFAYSLYGLYKSEKKYFEIGAFNNYLKGRINELRKHSNAPAYNDIQELDEKTRTQKIQTMAITKLIHQEDFVTQSPKELVANFQNFRTQTDQAVKAVKESRSMTSNAKYYMESFISANGFLPTKYQDVKGLMEKQKMLSGLSKAQKNIANSKQHDASAYLDLETTSRAKTKPIQKDHSITKKMKLDENSQSSSNNLLNRKDEPKKNIINKKKNASYKDREVELKAEHKVTDQSQSR